MRSQISLSVLGNKLKRMSLLVAFSLSIIGGNAQILINEFQASNIDTKLDHTGNYREWVELYNAGSTTIDLKGYFLSNDLSNPYQHEIIGTRVLSPNRITLLWIDKDNYDPCCIFRLTMEGGVVGLFTPSGELLDSVSFPPQYLGISYGRYPDGADHWSYFPSPTAWKSNITPGMDDPLLPDELLFSLEGGIYQDDQVLELGSLSGEGTIYYTLDGSRPTLNSPQYTGPILLTETSVVRAFTSQEGRLPGPTLTHTYILNDSSSIPVVSIVTDSKHFFDKEYGFYVKGINGIIGKCATEPANFYQEWERPANMEYFDTEGTPVINQMVGLKMTGGCSRKLPNKSIAVFARKKYGDNSLSHRFFRSKDVDDFKAIVLRNSSDDASKSMLRDGFMQSIVAGQIDLDLQGYQPVNVFLNGEYWGILNVRERVNEHYPASNFQMDSDQVDMLERKYYTRPIAGSGEHYIALLDFVKTNSLANQDNYAYVETQMDVNEYMNYFLSEIYFANEDWPHNNIKYWRPQLEGGKWRWVVFDTDFGWGLYPRSGNTLVHSTSDEIYSVLINALLENEEFRNEFIQRMASLINTVFHPDRVTILYDSLLAQLDREIDKHFDRWSYLDEEVYLYQTREKIPKFTRDHPALVRSQVMDFFNITGMYELSLGINDPAKGHVKISGINVSDGFQGFYFNEIPLRLEAIAASGYTFSHWEGADNSSNKTLFINSSANTSLTAVFVVDTLIRNLRINELCAKNLTGIEDDFGQMEDWIEIYNDNNVDVDLAGLLLSDSSDLNVNFRIPVGYPEKTTVAAKDYLILWCDDEILQGPTHSNFKLKKNGEVISLLQQIDQELHVLDSVAYPSLKTDMSYGVLEESGNKGYMEPTPLASNESSTMKKLFINEFVSRNCGDISDEHAEADDWIELYNPGPDTLDLAGLYITDSIPDPLKHRIPTGDPATKLPPFGHIILWADNQEEQGVLHLDFKLDAKKEQIGLYQLGVGYIDSLSYDLDNSGIAYGRTNDGSATFQPVTASPGEANQVRIIENLFINEFMAKNNSTALDSTEIYDDWIEIYNQNDFPVDIGGLYLTDSLEYPTKYRIPGCEAELTTIPARGFLVLRADNREELGALHLDFKLSGDGEEIGLFLEDGITVIDSLSFASVEDDMALGRMEDGENTIQIVCASPGYANYVNPTVNLYISEFSASGNFNYADESGEYDDWIEIYNDNDFEVDIGGLFLTDSLGDLRKYHIPRTYPDSTRISAKGYMILWADNQEEQGIRHLGFKLKGSGEQLALVDMDGLTIIDSVSYPNQYSNFTYNRLNQTGEWRFIRPTHGAENVIVPVTGIYINEFMASSNSCIPDDCGEFDDWIEIYNANDFPVDVGGLYLTDSIGEQTKFRISSKYPDSTTIGAKDYLILWADNQDEQGISHLGFKLNGDGEQLALVDADGLRIIDSLSFPNQYSNFTYSRINPWGEWRFMRPTLAAENVNEPVSGIYINEFMASNSSIPDEYGEYDDWIEIYNANNFPVDLGGLYLTDSSGERTKFRISSKYPEQTTIEAQGFLLIYADDQKEQGILHTNFKLSSDGEAILLYHYDASTLIDSISYPEQYKNSAFGYINDTTGWLFVKPTPGSSNFISDYSSLVINEIMGHNKTYYSDEYSEYDDWIELYNTGDSPIDIGGLYLSDSLEDPRSFRISTEYPDSTTIAPGEYIVLWADNSEDQGILHLGFKISKTGEFIGIFDPSANLIDSVSYPFISPNLSYGRITDGDEIWTIFSGPTPSSENIYITGLRKVNPDNTLSIYPNPVKDEAVIEVSLDKPSDLVIDIIDSKGRLCSQILEYHHGHGLQTIHWKALSSSGKVLENGLYFCRIRTGTEVFNTKFLVVAF